MPTTSRKEGLIKGSAVGFQDLFHSKNSSNLTQATHGNQARKTVQEVPRGKEPVKTWQFHSFTRPMLGLGEWRSGIFNNVASWYWKRFCEMILYFWCLFSVLDGVFSEVQKDTYV